MTGNNSIKLNEETLKAAVQHYFDKVLFIDGKSPKVESVMASSTGVGANFTVAVRDRLKALA